MKGLHEVCISWSRGYAPSLLSRSQHLRAAADILQQLFSSDSEGGRISLLEISRDIEVLLIQEGLRMYFGVVRHSAKHLGLKRTTLIKKVRKYSISYSHDGPERCHDYYRQYDMERRKIPTVLEDCLICTIHEGKTNLRHLIDEIEILLIVQALVRYDGTVSRAAKHLGLKRTTLVEKIKRYHICAEDYRKALQMYREAYRVDTIRSCMKQSLTQKDIAGEVGLSVRWVQRIVSDNREVFSR
jgi:transcriptional regulator with GAF, ATPase, and Fis domain